MQRSVEQTLEEIGAGERPRLLVLNKVDLLDAGEREELRLRHPDAVLVSGATGEGLAELGERIERELLHTLRPVELLVPYADGGSLAELHELAGEVSREDTPEGVRVRALVPARLAERFARFARACTAPRRTALSALASGRRRCPRARRGAGARAASRGSLGDLVEVEAELARELGDIPEHVAELLAIAARRSS